MYLGGLYVANGMDPDQSAQESSDQGSYIVLFGCDKPTLE